MEPTRKVIDSEKIKAPWGLGKDILKERGPLPQRKEGRPNAQKCVGPKCPCEKIANDNWGGENPGMPIDSGKPCPTNLGLEECRIGIALDALPNRL